MLTREENDLLTRTGPGTPGGDLLRRYWQPVALSEELPPGGAPIPLRVLSEDLVLFRDEQGRLGLLGLHCSHRGADLSYGRLEDGGLRCLYHGWLYDVHGRCLEQPGEPAGSTFHERILQRAYPCVETGGLVLAYLGPGEPPLLPRFAFLEAPLARCEGTRVTRDAVGSRNDPTRSVGPQRSGAESCESLPAGPRRDDVGKLRRVGDLVPGPGCLRHRRGRPDPGSNPGASGADRQVPRCRTAH